MRPPSVRKRARANRTRVPRSRRTAATVGVADADETRYYGDVDRVSEHDALCTAASVACESSAVCYCEIPRGPLVVATAEDAGVVSLVAHHVHRGGFVLGVALIITGVVMHLPDYMMSAEYEYRMAHMGFSVRMAVGMTLIVLGVLLAVVAEVHHTVQHHTVASSSHERLLPQLLHLFDDAPMSRNHYRLLAVTFFALVIDTMKPATLSFILPGVAREYAVPSTRASMLSVAALSGTTFGSLLWGVLADRIGRRCAIVIAGVLFIATSICGFMPTLGWNFFMCFVMGSSAGGMLPVVLALIAEMTPTKRRSVISVLHTGLGTLGGYIAAAGLSYALQPSYSWRILWFPGLITGVLLLAMCRWIPESPRFLAKRGCLGEVIRTLLEYGVSRAQIVATLSMHNAAAAAATADGSDVAAASANVGAAAPAARGVWCGQLLRMRRDLWVQLAITCGIAIGWSLVSNGFNVLLPTMLVSYGIPLGAVSKLLFYCALPAIPVVILSAFLYMRWSGKTVAAFCIILSAFIAAFALVQEHDHRAVVIALIVVELMCVNSILGMILPYAAEVFPTSVRGTVTGIVAAASKIAGTVSPYLVSIVSQSTAPLFWGPAAMCSLPILVASLFMLWKGVSTRGARLE
jgi:putative MFS transporter